MTRPSVQSGRLFSLFRDMVDLYSPSGKEEELTGFLAGFLRDRGLPVTEQPVDETRCNLLVGGGDTVPDTLFLGHIDTVPAFDIEQYGFSERDGLCCGLGTTDMKGGCAALIEGFVAAAESGRLPPSVLLALVVGEEETGDGTQALLAERRFRSALVAEPTDLQVCLTHYGYVEMVVQTFGYRRHAAMSDRETNAIRALLRFLLRLEERVENEEPETVLNIRDLHSSESGFAVPDRCAACVDLHILPGLSAQAYAETISRFAEEELTGSRASRFEVDFPVLADGYSLDPEEPLARQLRQIYEETKTVWNPVSFKSHSDANLLKEAGCSPVILGPGQLAKAHTQDEAVDFNQVLAAAEIYFRMLEGKNRT